MQTMCLCKEDFKEESHWIALCDSLDIPNTVDSITIEIARIYYIEPE